MTCIRCQTRDAAKATGREVDLFAHYEREIDRLEKVIERRVREAVASIERDHERTVERLNETIARQNALLAKQQRKAS